MAGRRARHSWVATVAALVAIAVLGAASCSTSPSTTKKRPPPTSTTSTTERVVATPSTSPTTEVPTTVAEPPPAAGVAVRRVVDGDTIELDDGTKVRLIGIDTPESVDPRRPVECLGKEAAAHTASLLPPGTLVRLEYDVEREDRYGRTLAYVYRAGDGLFVNAQIAADGFAQQLTIPPNVAEADEIAAAVAEARANGRGLWGGACDGTSTTATAGGSGGGGTPGAASGACDPSYPDVCIPPAPPDLDCGDVAPRRFRVLPPDPHRFDGDHDGVGCEG